MFEQLSAVSAISFVRYRTCLLALTLLLKHKYYDDSRIPTSLNGRKDLGNGAADGGPHCDGGQTHSFCMMHFLGASDLIHGLLSNFCCM